MKLSELKNGETAVIVRLSGHGGFRKRIMEMGFIRGEKVKSVLDSPMHDPVKYHVMGYDVSLRRNEASMIEVLPEEEAKKELAPVHSFGSLPACDHYTSGLKCNCMHRPTATRRDNIIELALIGNPNSGKHGTGHSVCYTEADGHEAAKCRGTFSHHAGYASGGTRSSHRGFP